MSKANWPETRGVDREVDVDLDTIVGLEGIDAWNDYLCELLKEPYLLDISWKEVEGHPYRLRVTGYVEVED